MPVPRIALALAAMALASLSKSPLGMLPDRRAKGGQFGKILSQPIQQRLQFGLCLLASDPSAFGETALISFFARFFRDPDRAPARLGAPAPEQESE